MDSLQKKSCPCDASPLKNIMKKFANNNKTKIVKEKDVFESGCNDKLFVCEKEPPLKKNVFRENYIFTI
jgi:hypothetical protein|tara:strand:+ start:411 stop:617 length:207 start_codon:yes stop_codon:yes gene_type:complete